MTKPTEWHVCPAKTQISLGIRPVWSESSLSAWRKLGSLATHEMHSEDSDQTWQINQYSVAVLEAFQLHNSVKGKIYWHFHWSRVKRICVFEHSVTTNFNCACLAIQRGQGTGFLSEGSSWLTACMNEQWRFWRDCADVQARLNLRCSHRR